MARRTVSSDTPERCHAWAKRSSSALQRPCTQRGCKKACRTLAAYSAGTASRQSEFELDTQLSAEQERAMGLLKGIRA